MTPRKQIPTDTPLGRAIAGALTNLETADFSKSCRRHYRSTWLVLLNLAKEEPEQTELSEELRRRFLVHYRLSSSGPGSTSSNWIAHLHRSLHVLEEFARYGCLQPRKRIVDKVKLQAGFASALAAYLQGARCSGNKRRTLRRKAQCLTEFLDFANSRGAAALTQLTPAHISDFLTSRVHLHSSIVRGKAADVRSFVHFLAVRGLHAEDLSWSVPKVRVYSDARIPSVWKPEEVEKLLTSIDRSSPIGKRDYAILALATRLGLRAGDIRGLRLEHLHWDRSLLEMPQSKTGVLLSLPLTEEVGRALIDYLRHGRPNIPAFREVFLTSGAPFVPLRYPILYRMIASRRRSAGIGTNRQGRRGLHSLRHTLATRLLEAGTPFSTISSIMGHLVSDSTRIYTKVDLKGLRGVALDPEEVLRG